jgi:hypothetical protein
VPQDRERLRPKGDLVSVEKQAAALKIEDEAIAAELPCPGLRCEIGVASGHCLAIHRILFSERRLGTAARSLHAGHGSGPTQLTRPGSRSKALFEEATGVMRDHTAPATGTFARIGV